VIEAGTKAPDFSLPDQDGNQVSLSDFAGQKLVLVFYPLDFSPVCSDQLSIYQEVLSELESQGATLVGISVDSSYVEGAGISNRCLVLIEDGEVKWSYAAPNPGEIPGANLIFDALAV
jgi:peroxiredoxin